MKENRFPVYYIFLAFLLLSAQGTVAQTTKEHAFKQNESVIVHTRIANLKNSRAPLFIDGKILFSYMQKGYVRRVSIAFAHENYSILHPFLINENGIFIFVSPIPEGLDFLDYRFVVDGLWINDPNEPDHTVTDEGILISRLNIPYSVKHDDSNPVLDPNGSVRFVYSGNRGETVYLTGNFNNWDPFMFKMKEDPDKPGFYSIKLRISPGKNYYTFITNGREITDPLNPDKAVDKYGKKVSFIMVP